MANKFEIVEEDVFEILEGPFEGFQAVGFQVVSLPGFPEGVIVKSCFAGKSVEISEEFLKKYDENPVDLKKFTNDSEILEVSL